MPKFLNIIVLVAAVTIVFGKVVLAQDVIMNYEHALSQSSFQGVAADYGDSGYIAAGYTRTQFTGLQGIIVKLNRTGQVQWGGSYGDIHDQIFYAVDATADHGLIAAGGHGVGGAGAQDYLAVKYDSVGNVEWEKEGEDPDCKVIIASVAQLTDGGYVMVGHRYCPGETINDYNYDFYAVKLSSSGSQLWENSWGQSRWDLLYRIHATSDGGFVVAGYQCDDEGSNCATYVSKHSSGGGLTWTYTGPTLEQAATGVRELPDGGFIVCVQGDGDFGLVRLSASGGLVWNKTFPLVGQQYPTDVEVHCDGGYSVVGRDYSQFNLKAQVDVLRVASDGTQLWRRNFGGLQDDFGNAVTTGPDGGIIIAETRNSQFLFGNFLFNAGVRKITDDTRQFVIMSGDSAKLKETEVEIRKLTSANPNWNDSLMYRDTTDADGKICVCDTLFGKTRPFKVRKYLHSEPTTRHAAYFGTKYSVTIDNMNLMVDGSIEYDTLTDAHNQNVVLDHSTFAFNLAVAVEWDTRDGYLASLQNSFRYLNNYLYDVYDGQVVLDTVAIVDDRAHWDAADVRYYASNMQWPRATAAGIDDPPPAFLHMPRDFHGRLDDSRNLTATNYPPVLTATTQYRTVGHEIGHYVLGFKDEYVFPIGSGKCASNPAYGYMETQYDTTQVMTSEMSSSLQYTDAACQNTAQYVENGKSCWDYFEQRFQKAYGLDTVFAEVLKPTERPLPSLTQYALGPNESNSNLDSDVGAHIVFPQSIGNAGSATKTVTAKRRSSNAPVSRLVVNLRKSASLTIEQGQTSDAGKIKVLDVSPGDRIRAAGSARLIVAKNKRRAVAEEWLYGEAIDGTFGKSGFGNQFTALADDIDLEMIPVQGDHQFVAEMIPSETGHSLRLYVNDQFSSPPVVDHAPAGGNAQSFGLSLQGIDYEGEFAGAPASAGSLTINAIDDSSAQFFVETGYASSAPFSGGELSSTDGSAAFKAGVLTPWDKASLLVSAYPILRNGLTDDNIQVGKTSSLGLLPENNFSSGEVIVVRYADSDLEVPDRAAGDETSLRIFKWNVPTRAWLLVGGSVDTAFNEVTAQIASAGVYAAFTTSIVNAPPCGDIDNSGQIDITDAVYLINYIFADGPAPQDIAGGDFDCNGQTDVTDAVYMVNYLFADGPSPCAACP